MSEPLLSVRDLTLRAYAEYGNDSAAVMLVRLLFDRGDQKAVEELRARSDSGDRYAGQRLADLQAGGQDPEAVAEPAHTCRRW